MATHSGTLAWRIPWTEEPGGPQSLESQSQTLLSDTHMHKEPMSVFIFQMRTESEALAA